MNAFRSLILAISCCGLCLASAAACADDKSPSGSAKKLKVLVVAGGHPYDVKPFREMFSRYPDMDCTFVEEKTGGEAFENTDHWPYDAIVLYNYRKKPSSKQWENFLKQLDRGTGLVILHHAIYGYRPWPEFQKIVGVTSWLSGTKDNVDYRIHIEDPQHPITQGLSDFPIRDEVYKGHTLDPKVHVLLTTDEPSNSKAIAWVHYYGRAPVCYLQSGHGPSAYANPQFREFLGRAIRWSAKADSVKETNVADQRARKIVAQMTLDEKVSQMHGTKTKDIYRIVIGVPRLGIPDLLVTNGPAGFGPAGPGHQSRATALPAPIALAATFDLDAAREYGVISASEAADFGNTFFEAPDVNIARVPQNGRTFEAYGEDPFLVSRLAVANIQGIQSQGIIANVKHYALNNQEENRHKVNADVDERTLREIYLPAFEASVKEGKVASFMGAYNKYLGIYCCENDVLLNQILRKDWGFRGFVTSDFGAVYSTVDTVLHGCDVEMPDDKYLGAPLKKAIEAKQISIAAVDESLIRRFRTMMEIGVWDHPPVRKPIPAAENAKAAQRIAEEGIVLLRNEGGILPLNMKTLKKVALIGPGAMEASTGGGGSSKVSPIVEVAKPLDGLRKRLGEEVKITLVKGDKPAAAAAAAKAADLAIVMVRDQQTEGRDHKISLSGSQDALVAAVAAANPKTVVVVKTGGPVLMPWAEKVPAIVEVWYPGEMDAEVVAAVLCGDCNPSGKLPITFPKGLDDLAAHTPEQYPGVDNVAKYSEGVMVGYRWYDQEKIAPLYPFGFGLSYSTFAYDNLRLSADKLSAAAAELTVEFDVANKSGPAGAEVAQVYVGLPSLPGVPQPPRQLKGFARVFIEPGKTAHVRIPLDARAFSYWDVQSHSWKVAPGEYSIEVGSSSRDIRLKGRVGLSYWRGTGYGRLKLSSLTT